MNDWHFIQAAGLKPLWPSSCFTCPDFCVWSICGLIDLDQSISGFIIAPDLLSTTYMFTTCSSVPMLVLSMLILPWFCIKAVLAARQVAWSLGGWIWRHLRGCFVQILFKEPTFLVGTGSVSLLLLCDMIQRLYLFLSSLWYSQRQRQSCLPDHWLCREAQQCQKRIAVCCHCADVI